MEPHSGPPAILPNLDGMNAAGKNNLQLEIDIVALSSDWITLGQIDDILKRVAMTAYEFTEPRICERHTITIALSNDSEARMLNKAYRGIDRPTNVLSFPFGDGGPVRNDRLIPLGDIILAFETVMHEANDAELNPLDHVCHLVAHGTLHLLGFDHEDDVAAQKMEALESKIMLALGLPDPYGESSEEGDPNLSVPELKSETL